MLLPERSFTPPTNRLLRWFVAPVRGVPPQIASLLLGEMLSEPRAVLLGLLNGLLINSVALWLDGGREFLVFIVADVGIVTTRLMVVHETNAAARLGRPTPTDLYLSVAASWCALQGLMAFMAMGTGSHALQILAAVSAIGLVGPTCGRNYAAPRFALLLICLLVLPFVAGAALTGEPWLMILVAQTPIFLFGSMAIIRRFHDLSVAALRANYENEHRARHDGLTGLLNRFGLWEAVRARERDAERQFTLFYLDLDGFKQVNDTHGHHIGDALLCSVARRLRSVTRAEDVVARLGGDEFVIVASGISPAKSAQIAAEVISRVAGEPYPLAGAGKVRIGISVGFACAPEDGTALDDLHQKADAALYEAKSAGKGVHRRFRASRSATQREDWSNVIPMVRSVG